MLSLGLNIWRCISSRGASYSGPLDVLSAVSIGAWGLRKQLAAYSGNAIKVRRSSDDATQDIGFVAGALDTASLLAFCGANSGYVDTLYDQKGTAHFSQLANAAQPRIVNAGVLETKNGKATITFTASQFMATPPDSIVLSSNTATLNAVTANDGIHDGGRSLPNYVENGQPTDISGNGAVFGYAGGANVFLAYRSGDLAEKAFTANALCSVNSLFDGTNSKMYVNNSVGTSVANSRAFGTSGGLTINSTSPTSGVSQKSSSCFSEFTLFDVALGSTDRTTLNANQAAFYGL